MNNCSVLIGIVTRNRCTLLPKAVTSALNQSGASVRVVVLDDGSTDETPRVRSEFPTVEWIRWEKSLGHMAARNYLMENSAEELFVGLDDDAWFLAGNEIAAACAAMKNNRKIAAVAFDILSPDHRTPAAHAAVPIPTACFIGCGHMLRLSAVRQAGFYTPSPEPYGAEEKDLCLRLLDAGYEIIYLPGVHIWHEKTALQRHTPVQHRSGVCNDLAMTLRRTPAWLLPAALAAKFYRHFRFSRRNNLTRPCLEGFALFARSSLGLLRSRKPVKTSTLRTFLHLRPE